MCGCRKNKQSSNRTCDSRKSQLSDLSIKARQKATKASSEPIANRLISIAEEIDLIVGSNNCPSTQQIKNLANAIVNYN